jgi:hypothetical protein
MGPYVEAAYNLALCRLQSRLQHMYHITPMPESTLSPSQGLQNSVQRVIPAPPAYI